MVNNVQKNAEQRQQPKQLGGITGRGFMSGQSGNPHGRPHTKGLLTALRNNGPGGASRKASSAGR
jgi:hypothetical protein